MSEGGLDLGPEHNQANNHDVRDQDQDQIGRDHALATLAGHQLFYPTPEFADHMVILCTRPCGACYAIVFVARASSRAGRQLRRQ